MFKLRCEIQRSLPNMSVDFFLFDEQRSFKISEGRLEEKYDDKKFMSIEPLFSLPLEYAELFLEKCAEYHTKQKLDEGTVTAAKNAHINDLNKVLNHFLAKDKNTYDTRNNNNSST